MKNFAIIIVAALLFSCNSSSSNSNTVDTMNGINVNPAQASPVQDTNPSPSMNGHAPPNTTTDTSQRVKDSIQNANKR